MNLEEHAPNKFRGHSADIREDSRKRRGSSVLWRKNFLARPTRFELVTSAFGGQEAPRGEMRDFHSGIPK
jgi:hypothetical protein